MIRFSILRTIRCQSVVVFRTVNHRLPFPDIGSGVNFLRNSQWPFCADWRFRNLQRLLKASQINSAIKNKKSKARKKQSRHQSINQSINRSIIQLLEQSINQSKDQWKRFKEIIMISLTLSRSNGECKNPSGNPSDLRISTSFSNSPSNGINGLAARIGFGRRSTGNPEPALYWFSSISAPKVSKSNPPSFPESPAISSIASEAFRFRFICGNGFQTRSWSLKQNQSINQSIDQSINPPKRHTQRKPILKATYLQNSRVQWHKSFCSSFRATFFCEKITASDVDGLSDSKYKVTSAIRRQRRFTVSYSLSISSFSAGLCWPFPPVFLWFPMASNSNHRKSVKLRKCKASGRGRKSRWNDEKLVKGGVSAFEVPPTISHHHPIKYPLLVQWDFFYQSKFNSNDCNV